MLKKLKWWLVGFGLVLSGCAHVAPNLANPTNNSKLASAHVIWSQPLSLPISYEILGANTPETRESWRKHHTEKVGEFMKNLEKTVPSGVQAFLAGKGVGQGSDAVITIRPIRAGSNSVGPMAALDVNVRMKDSAAAPWSIVVSVGSSIVDTNDTTAARIVKTISTELEKSGFVGQQGR